MGFELKLNRKSHDRSRRKVRTAFKFLQHNFGKHAINDRNANDRPVSPVVKTLLSVRKVWGSISGPVKSDTVANNSPPLQYFLRAVLPLR